MYIIACLSDVADGYIARHYNQVSNFGKFMDPLADKMLVLAAMCIFIERGQMPAWCVAIVLFREFAVSGLRLLAVEQGRVIAAAISGKLKTGCTMVGLGQCWCFVSTRPSTSSARRSSSSPRFTPAYSISASTVTYSKKR